MGEKTAIQEAMENFCISNEEIGGLMPIDTATGSGKTYSVANTVAEKYAGANIIKTHTVTDMSKYIYSGAVSNDKTIHIYLTTKIKNVKDAADEIEKRFKEHGRKDEFKDYVQRIPGETDKEVLDAIININNEGAFKRSKAYNECLPTYEALKKDIKNYNRAKKSNHADWEKECEDKVRRSISAFKNAIRKYLRRYNLKEYDEWIKYIEEKDRWIMDMFDICNIHRRKVLLFTVSKLMYSYNSIYEKGSFFDSDMLDHAVIFFDESDACKGVMLDAIIDKKAKNDVELIDFFISLKPGMDRSFPIADEKIKELMTGLVEKYNNLYASLNMECYYLLQDNSMGKNPIVFRAEQRRMHRGSFYAYKGEGDDYNNIVGKEMLEGIKRELEGKNRRYVCASLNNILARIDGFIKKNFALNIKLISEIIYTMRRGSGDFTLENARNTILDHFGINGEKSEKVKNYLDTQIRYMKKKNDRKRNRNSKFLETTVFEGGFHLYSLNTDSNHAQRTLINDYNIDESPEKILEELVLEKKARVILLSATATFETAIGNFCLSHIKDRLERVNPALYHTLTAAEKAKIEKEYEQKHLYYDKKVKFRCGLIEGGSTKEDVLKKIEFLFPGKDVDDIYDELRIQLKIDPQFQDLHYEMMRILKIIEAFLKFMQEEKYQSGLAITPKLYKYESDNMNALQTIAKCYIDGYKKDMIRSLDNADGKFDDNKKELLTALENGEKIFVVSSYATIGEGQNLQYRIPEKYRNVVANVSSETDDISSEDKKDFDFMYLELPTHKIIRPSDIKKASTYGYYDETSRLIIAYIFQCLEMNATEEISSEECTRLINLGVSGSKRNGKMQRTKSEKIYTERDMVQSIGRVGRTSFKNIASCIYLDINFIEALDYDSIQYHLDNLVCNVETKMVYKMLLEHMVKKDQEKEINDNRNIDNHEMSKEIVRITLKNFEQPFYETKSDDIEDWEDMRKFVLQHPTGEMEDIDTRDKIQNLYMSFPEKTSSYRYNSEVNRELDWIEDYNSYPECKPTLGLTLQKDDNTTLVSDMPVRRLMQNLKLKAHFEQEGYATEFTEAHCILSPILFKNIYKGALGEEVGKFYAKEYLDLELKPLPEEIYEKLDFRTEDGDIYFDFKYWSSSSADSSFNDWTTGSKKYSRKAKECNAKLCIIANVLCYEDEDAEKEIEVIDGITFVRITGLYIEKDDGTVCVNEKSRMKILKAISEVYNEDKDKQTSDEV